MLLTNKIVGNKLITTKRSDMQLISPIGYFDDNNYFIGDIGFDFPFYGTNYRNNIYVGTNSYVTLGFGSNVYSGLSSTSPGKGILIAASDNGIYSGIFVKKDIPGESFRIRFRGTNREVFTENITWEITLFSDGKIKIDNTLITPRTGAISMITKGDGSKLTSFTASSSQSLLYTYDTATDNYMLV